MQEMQSAHDAPILDTLGSDVVENIVSRRDAIAKTGKVGGMLAAGLAVGSVPVALAALSREAYGQAPATSVVDVLQFALLLENLEAEFYRAVTGTSSVPAFNGAFAPVRATLSATDLATFNVIRMHEQEHVAFLRAALSGAGATPTNYDPATTFDFTGGRGMGNGPFAAATTNRDFLLAAAQLFEDTGVRAYKGQAGYLLRQGATLTAALQIHAVEARHASRIRRMRRVSSAGTPSEIRFSGTVQGNGTQASGLTAAAATLPFAAQLAIFGVYDGEGNQTHYVNPGTAGAADVGIDATKLPNLALGPDVSAAFDEPLTRGQVLQIVRPFVIPDLPVVP